MNRYVRNDSEAGGQAENQKKKRRLRTLFTRCKVLCLECHNQGPILLQSRAGNMQTEAREPSVRSLSSQKQMDEDDFDAAFDRSFPESNECVPNSGRGNTEQTKSVQSKVYHRDPIKTEGFPSSVPSSGGSSDTEFGRFSPSPDQAHTASFDKNDTPAGPKTGYTRQRPSGRARVRSRKDSDIPPGIRKLPSPPSTLEQAQMEWDLVETVQPGSEESGIHSPLVTFVEALRHFQGAVYLEQHMSHIKPTITRRGLGSLTHLLFGPPAMKQPLHQERDLIFTLALCMFRNEEPMHNQVLQTIYKKLTGTKLDCPRYGNHWELIGFQGLDPATDLRGCGFLGLMNILYLLTEDKTRALAMDVYKLSQHETQNFPFSIMSINITRIALQALREGKLNKDCNQHNQVMRVFNNFYVAIFNHVYQIWKHQHKTISQSGFVLQEAEKVAKKNPRQLFRLLDKTLSERRVRIIPDDEHAQAKNRPPDRVDKFAGVCDLKVDEEEEVHLV